MIKLDNNTIKTFFKNKIGFKDEHPNLLLGTNVEYSNDTHMVAKYNLVETPIVGEYYTFTLWGELSETKSSFALYNTGAYIWLAQPKKIADGVYRTTFKWSNTRGTTTVTPTECRIYADNIDETGTSTIHKVKLEKSTTTPNLLKNSCIRKSTNVTTISNGVQINIANQDTYFGIALDSYVKYSDVKGKQVTLSFDVEGLPEGLSYTFGIQGQVGTPYFTINKNGHNVVIITLPDNISELEQDGIKYILFDDTVRPTTYGSTFTITNICLKTGNNPNQSYTAALSELPIYWSPAESELISTYTPNLFDYSSGYLSRTNVVKDNNYGFVQEVADSEQRYNWQIILIKDNNTYKQVAGVETTTPKRLVMPFTISSDYNNCSIRFKQNGKSTDTGIKIETEFAAGDYTLSVDITNVINGSIAFKNLKIEKGTVTTPIWTPAKSEWIEPEGPFNLLKGSKEGYILTSADSYGDRTSYSTIINSEGYLEYTITALSDVVNTNFYRYMHYGQNIIEKFKEGETYTLSLEAKTNAPARFKIDSRGTGTTTIELYVTIPNTNGEWKRFSTTKVMTGVTNQNYGILLVRLSSGVPAGSTASIRKVCLTKGTSPNYAPTYEEFKGVKIGKIYKGNTLVYPTLTPMPVVLVNKTTLNKVVTNNLSEYPASEYEPIGVVVIPAEHNVYGTGEAGVMALKEASVTDPDNGLIWESTGTSSTMYLGRVYNIKTLPKYTNVPITGTNSAPSDDVSVIPSSTFEEDNGVYTALLPIQSLTPNLPNICPYDPTTYYGYIDYYYRIPSPYRNGNRNDQYSYSGANGGNLLADFDGKGHTNDMIEKSTAQSDWKTANIITNNNVESCYPGACACWRYHTIGTNQGDWYIPSAGEMGYIIVRQIYIDNTLACLNKIYGSNISKNIKQHTYTCSTSYTTNNKIVVTLPYMHINRLTEKNRFLPFTRIKI